MQITFEKVPIIQQRLRTAFSRQKSYADPRSVYPEVVSECSVVWCPSVGCTDLRARSVSEYREQQMFSQHGS